MKSSASIGSAAVAARKTSAAFLSVVKSRTLAGELAKLTQAKPARPHLQTMNNETRAHQRQLAAIHQSGHVVAWLLQGQRMDLASDFVTLTPDSGGQDGWHYLLHDKEGQSRDLAVALLAGYAAELTMDLDAPAQNGAADLRLVRKLMREFAPAENVEQLEAEARDLARRFFDIITTFAGELLRRQTITGPHCEELFQQLLGSVTH